MRTQGGAGVFAVSPGGEAADVDAAPRHDADSTPPQPLHACQCPSILVVLNNGPDVGRAEDPPQGRPEERADCRDLRAADGAPAAQHRPQAGERVDDHRHARHARGKGTVEVRLKGEVLHGLRPLCPVDAEEVRDRPAFKEGIHAPPAYSPGEPAKAFPLQGGNVLPLRADEGHVESGSAEGPGEGQAEVVQNPVPVADQKDLAHSSWRGPQKH